MDDENHVNGHSDAEEIEITIDHPAPERPDNSENTYKSGKPKLIILTILLLLIGLGTGYFVFGQNNDDATNTAGGDQSTLVQDIDGQVSEQSQETKGTLDSIVYAHADDASSDLQVYTRPASGGDRVAQDGLSIARDLNYRTRIGDGLDMKIVNFENGRVQLVNLDGSSRTLFTPSNPILEVSGVAYDRSTNQIAIGLVDGTYSGVQPSVVVVDVESGDVLKVLTPDSDGTAATIPQKWDGSAGTLHYLNSCWGCDGVPGNLWMYENETSRSLIVTLSGMVRTVNNIVISDSGQSLLLEESAINPLGGEVHPDVESDTDEPATLIIQQNAATGEQARLAEFGHELTSADTSFSSGNYGAGTVAAFGWSDSQNPRPYYAYDNKVFQKNADGSESVLFESNTPISSVLHVSETEIIVGTRANDEGGEFINYLSFESGEAERIMETTSNTTILGFTYN